MPWLMTPYTYGTCVKRDLLYCIPLNLTEKGKKWIIITYVYVCIEGCGQMYVCMYMFLKNRFINIQQTISNIAFLNLNG